MQAWVKPTLSLSLTPALTPSQSAWMRRPPTTLATTPETAMPVKSCDTWRGGARARARAWGLGLGARVGARVWARVRVASCDTCGMLSCHCVSAKTCSVLG